LIKLFGIERLRGRGSASKDDLYTRYLPWDYPGAYGGSMELSIGDKEYRLQRSFHANDKSFTITELSTGREVKLKEGLISEMLPGLTESAFRNTISIEQLKAQMDLLRTLNDHLRSELDNTKRMLESSVGEICPALTTIDIDESADNGESFSKYEERKKNHNVDQIKSLYDLVRHVKRYAASQDKPLHYTDRDLRAFVAGLAASPLAVLQGMSGTGKTSLPKVFCDAIMGERCLVEVESSWRDRNEILGYYNDFSKKFTAKEFTCYLYKASCQRYEDTIYFIILDEMNLSRVGSVPARPGGPRSRTAGSR
jgi:hypothetical protein